jgi:hypothetical protein
MLAMVQEYMMGRVENVQSVDDTRNVTQDGQQDVDE